MLGLRKSSLSTIFCRAVESSGRPSILAAAWHSAANSSAAAAAVVAVAAAGAVDAAVGAVSAADEPADLWGNEGGLRVGGREVGEGDKSDGNCESMLTLPV